MHNETFLARSCTVRPLAGSETALRLRLIDLVRRRRVFDLACIGGRWTAVAARAAASIVATDPCDGQWSLAHRRRYDGPVTFASDIERGRALMPDPECLLAASLLARLGPCAARARIERCLQRPDTGVTLILLEQGRPSDALLRDLIPQARALSVAHAESVTLITCRIGPDRPHPATCPAAALH